MFDPVYTRPNQYRPYVDIGDVPLGPNDARSVPDVAGEMSRRSAAIRDLAEMRTRYAKGLKSTQGAAAQYRADYESLKTSFTEKYGADDPSARPAELFGDGDTVELSDRAKEYLADLGKLERLRDGAERLAAAADSEEKNSPKILAVWEAMDDMVAADWDVRFSPSKAARLEARGRSADAGNRMAKNGAEGEYDHAMLDMQRAAVQAGNAALTEGLSGPALFEVTEEGRIDFSVKDLEHLSPGAQAAAQLKRLVEIMSVRNGFSPLKGAVAKALDIQNAYIASHPVVAAATVELPF